MRRTVRVLWICAAFLVAAGVAAMYLKIGLGHDHVHGFVPKFELDAEMNVPTWFSSLLLAMAAALCGWVAVYAARGGGRFARHWRGLAWIFLLMSLDETAALHGLMTHPLRNALHLHGVFYYAWVLPMMAAVAVFGALYARFTWNLPTPLRARIVVAGIVYVTGALGCELIEGAYKAARGIDLVFGLITVAEETLEMTGVLLFIRALIAHLQVLISESPDELLLPQRLH